LLRFLGFAGLLAFPGQLFGELEGVHGVFVRLLTELMSGQMIPLPWATAAALWAWAARLWSSAILSLWLWGMASPALQDIKPRRPAEHYWHD
jgi:hypothetical protein